MNAKADTSAVPTELNDLSDVTISGTPAGNEALIFDTATSSFKSLPNFTNRFEDEAENNVPATPFSERVYTVKADGDGIFIDAQSDTPTAGKVIQRKIYHKAGFLESGDAIGDFTLIHTFADDTAYSATTSTFEGFRDGDTYGTPPFTLLQTWEEVDAFTGLLDTYSGAAAAYSLRQLRSGYTGDAVRVRRSSDNAEADIGFSNNELDTTALAAHCGSSDGFVKTWYDQSGSANDATQTSTGSQPKIYDGTTGVVTENGKPAIFKQNQAALLTFDSALVNGSNFLYTIVHGPCSAFGKIVDGVFFGPRNSNNYRHDYDSATPNNFKDTSIDVISNQILVSSQRVSTTSASLFTNGTITTNGVITAGSNVSTTQTAIFSTATNITAKIQELVFYNSDQSSNRTNIESNINTFYSIY